MNRVAFLIGVASYRDAPLVNPVNDANDLAASLQELGFRCMLCTDPTGELLERGLTDFGARLFENEVGLFFFAGHGLQIDGANYLCLMDTRFTDEVACKHSSLPLDQVLDVMNRGTNRTSIVVLDACRNNPYERAWRGVGTRGLAPVLAPRGTLIAYATSPGQVAMDGTGRNGRFTEALLKHVKTSNITVEDLFKRVRNTLSSSTNGKQLSWEHTSLMGDFHFNYAYVTEDFNATYDEAAIADAGYTADPESPLESLVSDLRSHNWYSQNPAVSRLSAIRLEQSNVNDLFVLGRSIYQAACGSANRAIEYLHSLEANLDGVGEFVSFHILNGLAFEIYFNSRGAFRSQLKSDKMDDVCRALELPRFSESKAFMRNRLVPHERYLFYLPGETTDVTLNIRTILKPDGRPAIAAIYYEGENILYSSDGHSYYDVETEPYPYEMAIDDLEKLLAVETGIPRRRLQTVYSDVRPERLLYPLSRKVQRVTE